MVYGVLSAIGTQLCQASVCGTWCGDCAQKKELEDEQIFWQRQTESACEDPVRRLNL